MTKHVNRVNREPTPCEPEKWCEPKPCKPNRGSHGFSCKDHGDEFRNRLDQCILCQKKGFP